MRWNGVLKVLSVPYKIYPPGEAPRKSPGRFKTYYNPEEISPEILRDVALAYVRVYAEPPWNESWEVDEVEKKIASELGRPHSCLTVMEGDSERKVGGFNWGAVVPLEEVASRIKEAHEFESSGIEDFLEERLKATIKGSKVFFQDEIAILREFRGGGQPLQFLTRPAMEVAVHEGVIEAVAWTVRGSKMDPLSRYMGYSVEFAEAGDIVFLYHPDLRPLVKLMQNISAEALERMVRHMSRLTRKVA